MPQKSGFICVALLSLFIVACTGANSGQAANKQSPPRLASGPSPQIVEGLNAREALALANEWKAKYPSVQTFVTTTAVNFTFSEENIVKIPLPKDQMVVAIAPYVEKTHPCEVHYMSGCQGELVDVPVQVLARSSDGTVLINDTLRTMDNGFIELWLPRNLEVDLSLSALDKLVEGSITTYKDSNTCVTTLKLQS
jgi:hypothetical protein